jgi:hypothetical protein
MAPYGAKRIRTAQQGTIKLPGTIRPGSYIALAIEGEHGAEGVYAAAEFRGKPLGFPDRASSFPVNQWEYVVRANSGYYTYYLPLTADMQAGDLKVYALFTWTNQPGIPCNLYYCESDSSREGGISMVCF